MCTPARFDLYVHRTGVLSCITTALLHGAVEWPHVTGCTALAKYIIYCWETSHPLRQAKLKLYKHPHTSILDIVSGSSDDNVLLCREHFWHFWRTEKRFLRIQEKLNRNDDHDFKHQDCWSIFTLKRTLFSDKKYKSAGNIKTKAK